MSDYNLRLFAPVISDSAGAFVADLTRDAHGWQRSIRAHGGPWAGKFRIVGEEQWVKQFFYSYIGFHVEEVTGGTVTWEGLVYEMDYTAGRTTRRRSLDWVANRVASLHIEMGTNDSEETVTNGGFEDVTAVPEWPGWNRNVGDGAYADETVIVHAGAHALKLTAGASANTYLRQDCTVLDGHLYELSFYAEGDGTNEGRYWIYDQTNSADIVALTATGVTGAAYEEVTASFRAPAGCATVRLYVYCSSVNGGVCYFDDVSLRELYDTVNVTSWSSNDQSVTRNGQIEYLLTLDRFPQAAAEAARDRYLKEHEWAWPLPIALYEEARGERGTATLDVGVRGYAHTANFRFVTQDDGFTDYVSNWIDAVVTNDCEFLSVGSIAENSLAVVQAVDYVRAWDLITELTRLGDASGNPWRFYVELGADRKCRYEQVDTDPAYVLRGDGIYSSVGERMETSPWRLQPGVYRDLTYPVQRSEPGTPWLADARDAWVEEVEVGVNSGIRLKTAYYEEGELLSGLVEYLIETGAPGAPSHVPEHLRDPWKEVWR